MKSEYGKTEDLVTDRLERLSKYSHPKEAKTDPQRFTAMYHAFMEVHTDMFRMGMLDTLNHPQSIKEFFRALPVTSQGELIKYKMENVGSVKTELEQMKDFMEKERARLKIVQEMFGAKEVTPDRPKPEVVCHNCKKPGHRARECTVRKGGPGAGKEAYKSHSGVVTSTTPAKPPCPARRSMCSLHRRAPGCRAARHSNGEDWGPEGEDPAGRTRMCPLPRLHGGPPG